MKDYVIAWLKSMELGFTIGANGLDVYLLFISMCISLKFQHLSLALPKYGIVLTNSDQWIYDDFAERGNYWFYRRPVYGKLCFYIMHIKGTDAIEVIKEKPNENL